MSVLFNLSSRYPSVRRSRILFKAIGQGFSTLYTCDYIGTCDFNFSIAEIETGSIFPVDNLFEVIKKSAIYKSIGDTRRNKSLRTSAVKICLALYIDLKDPRGERGTKIFLPRPP